MMHPRCRTLFVDRVISVNPKLRPEQNPKQKTPRGGLAATRTERRQGRQQRRIQETSDIMVAE